MVGNRGGLGGGCVYYRDAALRGRGQIYLVHADPDPADDPEPIASFQDRSREVEGCQLVQESVHLAHHRGQVLLRGDRNHPHRPDPFQRLTRNGGQLHPVE